MLIFSKQKANDIFDVSTLAHHINYTTSIDGNPGKLTFQLEKDPNGILQMGIGDEVEFYHSGKPVFRGKIFTLGTNASESYRVVAYDLLRYLKNHDSLLIPSGEMTIDDLFEEICTKWGLPHENIVEEAMQADIAGSYGVAKFELPKGMFMDVSLFDIMSWAMKKLEMVSIDIYGEEVSLIRQTIKGNSDYDESFDTGFRGAKYFLKDRFGSLELNEIALNSYLSFAETGVLVIGDQSLLTDYEYELSIDKDTYNELILVKDVDGKKTNGKSEKVKTLVKAKQADSVKKWGRLNKIITIKDGATESQIEEYLNLSLEHGNQMSKTLQLKALGFSVYAGDSFCLELEKLKEKRMMYIISASHDYEADQHLMTLEVATSFDMREVL